MTDYHALGIRTPINDDARLTRLGGSRMPPEVLEAMRRAAASYVDMHALQVTAGELLTRLTRNDAPRMSHPGRRPAWSSRPLPA